MPTLVRDPQPAEFEALLERRQRLGQDRFDEVWEGVYHMNPAPHGRHARMAAHVSRLLAPHAERAGLAVLDPFNLGKKDDYRIPDGGLIRPGPDELYYPTAAIVVEIVSPGDDTWQKLPFYAQHGVDEVLVVELEERKVQWLALTDEGEYQQVKRSSLIELGPEQLAERLDWPQ